MLFAYNVTVFFGKGDGIRVSPLFEQSTTTPDEEQEHSEGQSLAPLPALTNNLPFESAENTIHIHIKIVPIFFPQVSLSFGFIVNLFDLRYNEVNIRSSHISLLVTSFQFEFLLLGSTLNTITRLH